MNQKLVLKLSIQQEPMGVMFRFSHIFVHVMYTDFILAIRVIITWVGYLQPGLFANLTELRKHIEFHFHS